MNVANNFLNIGTINIFKIIWRRNNFKEESKNKLGAPQGMFPILKISGFELGIEPSEK